MLLTYYKSKDYEKQMSKIIVQVEDLGVMKYDAAWAYQTEVHNRVKGIKLDNRDKEEADKLIQEHYFLFCQHSHVYTLGKSGSVDHLLIDEEKREREQIDFHKINRGGDITYHGPGQIVGYPILDMDEIFTDIHKYVRFIEEMVIRTCADYGLKADRIPDFTGVWLLEGKKKRKICAIGVHLSRWVTMHGFAFNINTNLDYFNFIVPCGIVDEDKTVTSLSAELGRDIDLEEVKVRLLHHFSELFEVEVRRE